MGFLSCYDWVAKNVPVTSEDFLLPKCSKPEMLLKVSDHEDLLTIFEHF